jgi:carbamoyltransferase
MDMLYMQRSDIQAVTHVDFTARVQTVHSDTNPRFHSLIRSFREQTGYGLLVNTSFNVRGEPIVCTPEDAYKCFMRTEMDYLVIGDFVFEKEKQPTWKEDMGWKKQLKKD